MSTGNAEGEADSGAKQEGEEENRTLWLTRRSKHWVAWKEQISLWSISFTLPRWLKFTNRKIESCFGFGSPHHHVQDCPKDISKSAQKADLNTKEGTAKKGDWAPQKPAVTQQSSPEETPQT